MDFAPQSATWTLKERRRIGLAEQARDLRQYSALGRIRTCDTRFRRAVLYPLSYEG